MCSLYLSNLDELLSVEFIEGGLSCLKMFLFTLYTSCACAGAVRKLILLRQIASLRAIPSTFKLDIPRSYQGFRINCLHVCGIGKKTTCFIKHLLSSFTTASLNTLKHLRSFQPTLPLILVGRKSPLSLLATIGCLLHV